MSFNKYLHQYNNPSGNCPKMVLATKDYCNKNGLSDCNLNIENFEDPKKDKDIYEVVNQPPPSQMFYTPEKNDKGLTTFQIIMIILGSLLLILVLIIIIFNSSKTKRFDGGKKW
jgi:hypothetical protein